VNSNAALETLLGLLIGGAAWFVGAGGSIITVPALVYLFGEGAHAAPSEALLIATAMAAAGVAARLRDQRILWRLALQFSVPTGLTSYLGTALTDRQTSGSSLPSSVC
jgi:uncharacterized membrane protein YfcA